MLATYELPYQVSSAALSRRHVERFAADHQLDGATTTLAIIATELVSNAVLHGAEPVALTLRVELDDVTVEVFDGDPTIDDVHTPAANEQRLGGRGLFVVASLSDRWGVRPSHPGKTVWATITRSTAS